MVSPVNSPGATASCQKSMYQCGLLQQLCTILMATGVPADILTEVLSEMLGKYDLIQPAARFGHVVVIR